MWTVDARNADAADLSHGSRPTGHTCPHPRQAHHSPRLAKAIHLTLTLVWQTNGRQRERSVPRDRCIPLRPQVPPVPGAPGVPCSPCIPAQTACVRHRLDWPGRPVTAHLVSCALNPPATAQRHPTPPHAAGRGPRPRVNMPHACTSMVAGRPDDAGVSDDAVSTGGAGGPRRPCASDQTVVADAALAARQPAPPPPRLRQMHLHHPLHSPDLRCNSDCAAGSSSTHPILPSMPCTPGNPAYPVCPRGPANSQQATPLTNT